MFFSKATCLLLVLSVLGAYLPLSALGEPTSSDAHTRSLLSHEEHDLSIGGDGGDGVVAESGRHLLGHKKKHNYHKHHNNVEQSTGDVGTGGAGVGGSASTGNVNGDGNTGSIGGDGTGGTGVDNGRHLLGHNGHKNKHNYHKHYNSVQQSTGDVGAGGAGVGGSAATGNVNGNGNTGSIGGDGTGGAGVDNGRRLLGRKKKRARPSPDAIHAACCG